MTVPDEWERIAARIRGLSRATTALWEGLRVFGRGDEHGLTNAWLIPSAKGLITEIEAFRDSHKTDLGEAAFESLTAGLTRLQSFTGPLSSGIPLTIALVAGLLALESEVSFHIRDFDTSVRPLVERAFLHLQRSLVVDAELQKRWLSAFETKGETACEKLGGVHLLLHGIYAFKTSAKGERTDLVLGERLSIGATLRHSANALVLTEWKVAHSDAEAKSSFVQARQQAMRYCTGLLAGFELQRYRYLVLVSKDHVPSPEDELDGSFTYRHINVAISPSSPSRAKGTESRKT